MSSSRIRRCAPGLLRLCALGTRGVGADRLMCGARVLVSFQPQPLLRRATPEPGNFLNPRGIEDEGSIETLAQQAQDKRDMNKPHWQEDPDNPLGRCFQRINKLLGV